jgi:hypothetical protein
VKAELEQRWRAAFGQYANHRQAAEQQVVRWEWARSARHTIRPLFFERYPGRGRVLESEPDDKSAGAFQYGLDAQDRMVVERVYGYTGEPAETFVTWTDTVVEAIMYANFQPKLPLQVARLYFHAGRPQAFHAFTVNIGPDTPIRTPDGILELTGSTQQWQRLEETYHYDEQWRVSTIDFRYEGGPYARFTWLETFTYNPSGQIEQIEARQDTGKTFILYRRPEKHQTARSLGRSLKARLLDVIPEIWASAGTEETLYCMVLYYRASYFPPYCIPGYDRDRQAALMQNDPEGRYFLWTPVGDDVSERPFQITDPDVLELCRLYEQEITAQDKGTDALRLLRQLGKALTKFDWSGKLPVTSDFVVYAMDYEIDDLEECLRASVPKAQIVKWKKRGLLT